MAVVPDRIRWAVDLVDPAPADRILELGCGPGVAAALVCQRLETGRLVAVDRSPVAVRRTSERNAAQVSAGRLEVRQSAIGELVLPRASFDKVFAVNVNVFWTRGPAAELAVLANALRQGGSLYVLYGGGPTGADRVTGVVSAAVAEHEFTDVSVVREKPGIGVLAKRV